MNGHSAEFIYSIRAMLCQKGALSIDLLDVLYHARDRLDLDSNYGLIKYILSNSKQNHSNYPFSYREL